MCQYLSSHSLFGHVRIAFAGRCIRRLEKLRLRLGLDSTRADSSAQGDYSLNKREKVDLFYMDLDDPGSLKNVCCQAQVIVDCTG